MYAASNVSPKIGFKGFRKELATGQFPIAAVINNFTRSILSEIKPALVT